jgi:transcriptional regulator with XRE-family HTH domain
MAVRMDRSNDRLVAAFAAVLRERRENAGLTQEDLAERADVSARFISFLENGRRQPSLSALAALSDGVGASMSEFIGAVEGRYRGEDADLPGRKSVRSKR